MNIFKNINLQTLKRIWILSTRTTGSPGSKSPGGPSSGTATGSSGAASGPGAEPRTPTAGGAQNKQLQNVKGEHPSVSFHIVRALWSGKTILTDFAIVCDHWYKNINSDPYDNNRVHDFVIGARSALVMYRWPAFLLRIDHLDHMLFSLVARVRFGEKKKNPSKR